jgi:hypothetical protein
MIENLQELVPVSKLAPGDQRRNDAHAASEGQRPRHSIIHRFELVERHHIDVVRASSAWGAERYPRVCPNDQGCSYEHEKKQRGLSPNGCPEHERIADLRKPQSIDEEIIRESQQGQANYYNYSEAKERYHEAPPRLSLLWSGDPDRHDSIVAEKRGGDLTFFRTQPNVVSAERIFYKPQQISDLH